MSQPQLYHECAQLSWTQVRDLPPDRCVALLPIGAIEAHGPHLPLTTDVIIAQGMAHSAGRKLAALGQASLGLEALAYTSAPFARAFPGTVSLRPETFEALLSDVLDQLLGQGFARVALCNAHLDPSHIAVLRRVHDAYEQTCPTRVVFPDVTRRQYAQRLTPEFQSGACHAGQYETSIVLARAPLAVKQSIMRSLPENPHSLVDAVRAGKDDFVQSGGPEAYFGSPARASVEEGEQSLELLGQFVVEALGFGGGLE